MDVETFDVETFLEWASRREGKFELHEGRPVAMSPELVRHAGTKTEAAFAERNPARRIAMSRVCRRHHPPGAQRSPFVPDVLGICPPPPDVVEIDNPIIVVEALSPSTAVSDNSLKLESYLSLPSLAHYLILTPMRRILIHHARQDGAHAATRTLRSGALRLDPPGLDLTVEELFEPEPWSEPPLGHHILDVRDRLGGI